MATFDAQLSPFDLSSAVVLITGGSSGIGLGLVDELTKRGSRVLISARREPELQRVQSRYGKDNVLSYYVGDVGKEADRLELFRRCRAEHPSLNVLINCAGIQRRGNQVKEAEAPWSEREQEIAINLSAPIHLTSLFIPHMLSLSRPSAVVEVTSALAFSPFTAGPVYSATKAGLHAWTQAMRPLLADTSCRLVELIPPAVKTNLGGFPPQGEDVADFCSHAVQRLADGWLEIGFKTSETRRLAGRHELQKVQMHIIQADPTPTFTTH